MDSLADRVVIQMIEMLMEEPLYDTLRTKEQLGYSVSCGLRNTNGVLGFCIRLESERHDPPYIHGRIEHFLSRFRDYLFHLTDHAYYRQVAALIHNKLQREPSLTEETDRFWTEVIDRRYCFDVARSEVAALLTLKKQRVVDCFDAWLAVGSVRARHLCIQVTGQSSKHAQAVQGMASPRRLLSSKVS